VDGTQVSKSRSGQPRPRFAVAYLDTIDALPQFATWSAGSARSRNVKRAPGANPAISGAFQPGLVVANSYFSL
jgi:hypothetical protein